MHHRTRSGVLLALALLVPRQAAAARVDRIEAHGLGTTRRDTLIELLPRDPPAEFTDAELREFERRVRNLGLFDRVEVRVEHGVLRVEVDRKNNVEPDFDFATGATAADTAAFFGANHWDIDGKASKFGVGAGYAERFGQFGLELHQHDFRARKWSWEASGWYWGSEVRFDDDPTWVRGRLGGELEVRPPFWYASPVRVEFNVITYLERSVFAEGGAAPRGGQAAIVTARAFFDRWTFHDLVPSGVRVIVTAQPGILLGPNEPRHEARVDLYAAQPIGERTVAALRGVAQWVNTGNPNHSVLMGSQEGVRGLADTLYRDRMHAYANLELRHAFDLGKRWYLQPVVFADGARFQPMDVRGVPTGFRSAVSVGGGVRVLPTALIDTLLRVDVARLLYPDRRWFLQVGIDQYF
jgi:hypothetical protein